MVGTKFLVQWEEHPTHLATRLGYLLEHQSLVDVTLMCNTHTLKVHRSVLAACSPYFESVLQRQLGNQPLIVLKDMKFSVLKSLVEFMYCGETSVTEENLSPLMEAAKFFEVKGLSSMTKEAIGERSSTPLQQSPVSSSTMNGVVPSGRGGRRPGAGRGRRPSAVPVAQAPFTNPPTESAQILLSLSGSPGQSLQSGNRNVRFSPNNRIGKVFTQENNLLEGSKPYIRNGSLAGGDVANRPIRGGYEPRRRGRRRNPANIAYNRNNLAYKESEASRIAVENLQKEMDGQCDQKERPIIESKLSLWNTNTVDKSPLLASLLSKAENFGSKIKTENDDSSACENPIISDGETLVYQVDNEAIQGNNMKYLEALKEAGLPTDVPILIDNGDGNYITLTEDVLMNVMEGKEEFQFQVTEGTLEGHEVGEGVVLQDGSIVMERKKNIDNAGVVSYSDKNKDNALGVRQFVVKEMQATKSDEEDLATVLSESIKKEGSKNGGKMSVQEIINEAMLETLKSDSKEAELDPDAVVLFEVTENSKVEKYVVSSKEVNVLKALNEQIVQRKKHLQEVKKTPLSPVGVIGGNTKIAEVKLTIGKSKSTKSILSQVLECAQEKLKQSKSLKPDSFEKKDIVKGQSQLVELEFIDGNGEKIEGYQVEGTVISDKQFEEMNTQHSDNSTSKDDDVMNLLTLDQELSESDRIINNNIDHERCIDLVDASDRGKDGYTIIDKDDVLQENYCDNEIISEKEDNLCIENSEHLDVNKIQNLDVNKSVQNLDDNVVQNLDVNIIQNEDETTVEPGISLPEDECSKVLSVEQALEAMMGVEEAMLIKSGNNIGVVEKEEETVDVPYSTNSDVITESEESITVIDEKDSSNIESLEKDDSIVCETDTNGINICKREESSVCLSEGEDISVSVSERDENNVIKSEETNVELIESQNDNSLIIEEAGNPSVKSEAVHPNIVQSDLHEVSNVCSTEEDLSLLISDASSNQHIEKCIVSTNTSDFQECLDSKDEFIQVSKSCEEVIVEPVTVLDRLDEDEVKSSGLLNEVLNSQMVNNEFHDGKETISSPTKDVPFAVGLLPLKTALEKIQTIPEHQPRKTRSGSTSREETGVPKRRNSTCSSPHEPIEKKIKLCDVNEDSMCEFSEQIVLSSEDVGLGETSS